MNDKIDHSQMNLDQLQNAHSNMLATASDLGFQPPDDTLVEIESVEQGRGVCDALHDAITKFRAGIDAEDEAEHGDGASDGDNEADEEKKPTKKRRTAARGVASAKKSRQGAPPEENKENNQMTGTDEKKVKKAGAAPAKKAAKKAAAPAKKAAKKAAAPAKKALTNGVATKAAAFDDNAKITWTYKGEGTGCRGARHDRVELVRKANGKTVKTYLANGGRADTLRNAVKDGKAKVA